MLRVQGGATFGTPAALGQPGTGTGTGTVTVSALAADPVARRLALAGSFSGQFLGASAFATDGFIFFAGEDVTLGATASLASAPGGADTIDAMTIDTDGRPIIVGTVPGNSEVTIGISMLGTPDASSSTHTLVAKLDLLDGATVRWFVRLPSDGQIVVSGVTSGLLGARVDTCLGFDVNVRDPLGAQLFAGAGDGHRELGLLQLSP